MTPEDRLSRLEDAVANLSDIIEQKFGKFSQEANPVVVVLGLKLHTFVAEVAAERM